MAKQPMPWTLHTSVHAQKAPLEVNLSTLPAGKKREVWERIKTNSPATAQLLGSDDFKEGVAEIQKVFGAVDIKVDLDTLGEQK